MTFQAELIRSALDAVNHLILYATIFIKVEPNKTYPYGE